MSMDNFNHVDAQLQDLDTEFKYDQIYQGA